MKKIVLGILAHVDSGKTTLSEGLLYSAGEIRKKGRVDHKDTFLDTDVIEKERGITIFSKHANLKTESGIITLLDTPGHIDFSSETERVLSVLDYAVLVVSGAEGVQSHSETLWHLLKSKDIPVFIFVNKMDISPYDENALINNIKSKFDENCINFLSNDDFFENLAMCDEEMMNSFLEDGEISDALICRKIKERKVFPCFFGSALKQEGVDEFLNLLDKYTLSCEGKKGFGAKIFKIAEDEQGNRLTYMKITGGELKVKDVISYNAKDGEKISEKVNSIRIYSGNKFSTLQTALPGDVCAILGLSKTFAGQGLGEEKTNLKTSLEPVFCYKIKINDGTDTTVAFSKLKKLQEEEPELNVSYNEQLGELQLRLMGDVQCEVLKRIIKERFSLDIDFLQGGIVYKETIKGKVEGVGHYEPLRHYAEAHFLIEEGERGSGIVVDSACSEDILAKNWQRLILSHIKEKTHKGVLTGAPITDVRITLVSGKAHLKHTEGGDFREATYRGIRQGLMMAESVLLEPWYEFSLSVPTQNMGRAMTDIDRMGGRISSHEANEETAILKGSASVSKLWDYQKDVTIYSKGMGKLSFKMSGYEPCTNQDEIVNEIGYDPESDLENTPDSVFCEHGAGFVVKWYDVKNYMHIDLEKEKEEQKIKTQAFEFERKQATDEELMRIFEMTYGKVNIKTHKALKTEKLPQKSSKPSKKPRTYDKSYLLVDGYNIIFADEELKKISDDNLDLARTILIDKLCNYKAVRDYEIIIVFDAYKVKGDVREIEVKNGVSIIFTKEAETADAYIEKTSKELSKNNKVQVATSDALEQIIIMGSGGIRISAPQLLADIRQSEREIKELIEKINRENYR